MFTFERLETWQRAIDFADSVYSLTNSFPPDERFGLATQMRRAAISVSSNLAEGTSRHSNADFARFIEIATGSIFEVVSQAFISRRRNFLSESDFKSIYASAEELGKMLSGLRTSIAKQDAGRRAMAMKFRPTHHLRVSMPARGVNPRQPDAAINHPLSTIHFS